METKIPKERVGFIADPLLSDIGVTNYFIIAAVLTFRVPAAQSLAKGTL